MRNRELARRASQRHYQRYPERYREYYQRNRVHILERSQAYGKKYYRENRARILDRTKAYNKRHPEIQRATNLKRRDARAATATVGLVRTIETANIKKHGQLTCEYCGGRVTEATYHIDHRVPISRGGNSKRSNLCVSCKSCNLKKHTLTKSEFLRLLRAKEVYK